MKCTPKERMAAVGYLFELFDDDRNAIDDAVKAFVIHSMKVDAKKRAAVKKSVEEYAARNPEHCEGGDDDGDDDGEEAT